MADFLESYINGLDLSDLQAQADAQRQKQESERRQEAAKKNILLLPLSALREAPETMQCFRAADEERLQELTESIRHNGVLSLPIVRPMGAGTYEIIAGRNRCRAARALGYLELPCIVRDVNDDEATELQIADNLLHREKILPSEKAKVYKRRLDGMRRKAGRPRNDEINLRQVSAENSDQDGQNLFSVERLASDSPDSKTQIQRYIRLNYLIPALLEQVDVGKLGLQLGATLSYLSELTQTLLLEYLTAHPDKQLSQAAADALRKLEEEETPVDEAAIDELLTKRQRRALRVVRLQMPPLRRYFPADATEEEVTQTVQTALEYYFSKRPADEKENAYANQ